MSAIILSLIGYSYYYFSPISIAKRNITDYLSRNVNDFSFYEPVEYGNIHSEYNLFGFTFKDSIRYNNQQLGFPLNENAPNLIYKDNNFSLKSRLAEVKIADLDSKMFYFKEPNGSLGVWVRNNSKMKRNPNYDDCIKLELKKHKIYVKDRLEYIASTKKMRSNFEKSHDLDFRLFTEDLRFNAERECGKEYYESNPYFKFDKFFILLNDKLSSVEQSKITLPTISYTIYHTFRLKNSDGNKVLLRWTFNLNDRLEVTSAYSNE